MRPISDLEPDVARRILAVLFDIDDTVLDHGRLSVESLRALYRLSEAGLRLVGVTGRPITWGQVLVRQWPIDGVVAENGALWAIRRDNRVTTLDRLSEDARRSRRTHLMSLVRDVQMAFPEMRPSDDAASRGADYTFDIAEAVVIPPAVVEEVTQYAIARGARVSRSSIHLHLSFDGDDKASGALHYLFRMHGQDPTASRYQCAFIGDSENDSPCFAAFDATVAVANLRGRPTIPPKYLTNGRMGAGFAEFAERLLLARSL